MTSSEICKQREAFKRLLSAYCKKISHEFTDSKGVWSIHVTDKHRPICVTHDTKIISGLLEVQMHEKMERFADMYGYVLEPSATQNYYPDYTLIDVCNPEIMYAVDVKSPLRRGERQDKVECTLGSHGTYFKNRDSNKNINHPYKDYKGHFCIVIPYSVSNNEITNIELIVAEKWKIASDKQGSGNTATIGSIKCLDNIINERGTFVPYGQHIFDDYWTRYGEFTSIQDYLQVVKPKRLELSKNNHIFVTDKTE